MLGGEEVKRSGSGPRSPGQFVDDDDRPLGSVVLVLAVFRDEGVGTDCAFGAARVDDAGVAVGADPPELGPVVGVVVDDEADGGVGANVIESLQFLGGFGFPVDGCVDAVAGGCDGVDDGDQVWGAVRVDGGELGAGRVGEALNFVVYLHVRFLMRIRCGCCVG